MGLDIGYTNGVIAAREKYLLKEKMLRLCELSAKDAFRMLLESGFGGGAETATSVYDYEKLIAAEEAKIDAFIREYTPSQTEKAYLLSARDFHNAKAIVKANYLQTDAERMLAPEGLLSIPLLTEAFESGDFSFVRAENADLAAACERAVEIVAEETPSGSEIGTLFENALYTHLFRLAKGRTTLKKLLTAKADMTNILTAARSADAESANSRYLPIGRISPVQLQTLFEDKEKASATFRKTPYAEFVQAVLSAKENGQPMREAERIRDGFETAYFAARKYDLERNEPFLYYVYRRRTECADVRIVFACLLSGMKESEIKKRLRGTQG